MARICIITYSRTRNYGGILQAYGLYRYLELKGHDVALIDYIPRRCNVNNKIEFVDDATSRSKFWGKNRITKWMFSIIRFPSIKKSFTPFLDFMDSRVRFTKAYYSEPELEKDVPAADIYITGSDQVWNSQFSIDQKLDLPFYLPFVSSAKKISYASSFGRDYIPPEHRELVKKLIGDYNAVSVREETGQKILFDLGINSKVVIDPTILCPIEEWEKIASPQIDKGYILLYQVVFNEQTYDVAKSVAEELHKKLICISLDDKDKRYIKTGLIVTPRIEDWLSYVKHADGVITDSFHASVFSILFKRQFIVNSSIRKGMSSRIINLLQLLDLEDRNVNSFNVTEVSNKLERKISWTDCKEKMKKLRDTSMEWLDMAIEK